MDFIQGEKFMKLADGSRIFYQHSHNLCFEDLPDRELILITHNSCHRINVTPPKNIIKWFAQNVNVKHNRMESIPIGLENKEWFYRLHKREKMIAKLRHPKKLKNLVYVNFNIKTNIHERTEPYNVFKDKTWATVVDGKNGKGFDSYLDGIYNHKFVVSPEGSGADTVRTWECLYVDTIPIEKRNINNQFYTDLPICFVDDWEEVTESFLEKEYVRIKQTEWNMDKLKFSYWKDKILAA